MRFKRFSPAFAGLARRRRRAEEVLTGSSVGYRLRFKLFSPAFAGLERRRRAEEVPTGSSVGCQ
jgi:hypothetical protein